MSASNFASSVAVAIFVVYTRRIMHLPDAWFGGLLAAGALGGVGGGLLGAKIVRLIPLTCAYSVILSVVALGWLAILLFPVIWVVTPALALIDCAHGTLSVVEGTTLQHETPTRLLARIVAQTRTLGVGSAGLGALVGGWIATEFGVKASIAFASGSAMAIAIVFLFALIKNRKFSERWPHLLLTKLNS
jgi:MFS family permease